MYILKTNVKVFDSCRGVHVLGGKQFSEPLASCGDNAGTTNIQAGVHELARVESGQRSKTAAARPSIGSQGILMWTVATTTTVLNCCCTTVLYCTVLLCVASAVSHYSIKSHDVTSHHVTLRHAPFCFGWRQVVEVFHEGDMVWVHGFHLAILPAFLERSVKVRVTIMKFLRNFCFMQHRHTRTQTHTPKRKKWSGKVSHTKIFFLEICLFPGTPPPTPPPVSVPEKRRVG